MKSISYILLGFISLFTFTTPNYKIEEIPVKQIHLSKDINTLNDILISKTDSLESLKEEVIQLQIEIGVRK